MWSSLLETHHDCLSRPARPYAARPNVRYQRRSTLSTRRDAAGICPRRAHVGVANPSTNNGAQILRRGYSYNDGANIVAERRPPWRQAMEYDTGLYIMRDQPDPRASFIPMLAKMATLDMLNQFATHVGSGIFAIPPGAARGEYIGQHFFIVTSNSVVSAMHRRR